MILHKEKDTFKSPDQEEKELRPHKKKRKIDYHHQHSVEDWLAVLVWTQKGEEDATMKNPKPHHLWQCYNFQKLGHVRESCIEEEATYTFCAASHPAVPGVTHSSPKNVSNIQGINENASQEEDSSN